MRRCMLVAFLSLFLGCGSKDDTGELEDFVCTASIEYSVYVTVYNEDGSVIENASVSYSSDPMSGDCEMDSVGGHYCGEEQSGDVTIFVSAEGYVDTEQTVTVEADVCHVITEMLDVTLIATEG